MVLYPMGYHLPHFKIKGMSGPPLVLFQYTLLCDTTYLTSANNGGSHGISQIHSSY